MAHRRIELGALVRITISGRSFRALVVDSSAPAGLDGLISCSLAERLGVLRDSRYQATLEVLAVIPRRKWGAYLADIDRDID